jgi:serpin B
MIENILDEIPELAVMYLVNALAFDAKWSEGYQEYRIKEGNFTNSDGTVSKASFMSSHESTYIKTPIARGFMKYYENLRYSFVALLPDKGKTTDDVVAGLDELLNDFEQYKSYNGVDTVTPKFSAEFDVELSDALIAMGMVDAFTDGADFSDLGTCPESGLGLHISRVLHKTFIELTESGTRAGAATVVEMVKNTAVMEPEIVPVVRLDRPFVYMLYDNETEMPFFIGVQNTLK